jgi:hypothetical protein
LDLGKLDKYDVGRTRGMKTKKPTDIKPKSEERSRGPGSPAGMRRGPPPRPRREVPSPKVEEIEGVFDPYLFGFSTILANVEKENKVEDQRHDFGSRGLAASGAHSEASGSLVQGKKFRRIRPQLCQTKGEVRSP